MAEAKKSTAPDAIIAASTPANSTAWSSSREEHDTISTSAPQLEIPTHGVGKDSESKRSTATESDAIDESVNTRDASTQSHSKPWYKTLNPLRWGRIPSIPEERTVSPEYKAGLFSLLTFAWITPLMVVSVEIFFFLCDGDGLLLINV
jgi:hypothetical protein